MRKDNKKILANEWFKKAADDYKSAEVVLKEGGYYGTTCFLSQQIAEKYLKGFLVYKGKNIEKVHDLIKLLNECKKIEPRLKGLEEECLLLNDYYIETRYPIDAPVDYKKGEAKQALIAVDKIMEIIMKEII